MGFNSLIFFILVIKMDKSFSEILNTNTFYLSFNEVLIQCIIVFLLLSIISLLSFFIIGIIDVYLGILFFIAFEIINLFSSLALLTISIINKHSSLLYCDNPIKMSFECVLILFCVISLGVFISCIFLGHFVSSFNFISCLIIGVSFLYPPIFMLFRKNIFNEKSLKIENYNDDIIGYNPIYYLILGFITGFILFYLLFITIENYYCGLCSLFYCIFVVLFSICLESLILSPDLMNDLLPFNIKFKKGFYLYFMISLLLCGIYLIICLLV